MCLFGLFKNKATISDDEIVHITVSEARLIIAENLRMDLNKMHLPDRNFTLFSLDTMNTFLQNDLTDALAYKAEQFDCDDFSIVAMGRQHEWFGCLDITAGGTAFGVVWGDIRRNEDDTKINNHAVNFFIDNKKILWLMEPQSDDVYLPTSNSTFRFALL